MSMLAITSAGEPDVPIRTLQMQQAQVGRIRIGQQVTTKGGKTRPAKLDTFRFTSPAESLAHAVANRYGGEVQRWTPDGRPPEWEVVSDAKSLPVLVPPHPVMQWMEMWSGSGCVRRCDGEVETISGERCKCPFDQLERTELAARGEACKATTRLKVMLPEIPGIGVWRLDSHGYFAAIELPGTAEFLGAVTESNGYIRAVLVLEERQVRRPGVGVRQFLVPALHVDVTPAELMAGGGLALGAGGARAIAAPTPAALPAAAQPDSRDVAQALADSAKRAGLLDDVQSIWRQATSLGLMEQEVADVNGVMEPLRAFLTACGNALRETPAAAPVPAASADVDTLWAMAMSACPEGWSTSDLTAAFRAQHGVNPSEGTAEQMQSFLDKLRGVAA